MHRILLIISTVIFSAAASFGQISVNFLECPADWGIESKYYAENDTAGGIQVNVGQAAGNQFWDFTAGDTTLEFTQTIVSVNSTPFGELFQDANLVIETDDLIQFGFEGPGFLYYQINPSGMNLLGLGVDVEGMSLPIRFESPMTWFVLPLDYLDNWDNWLFVQQYYDTLGMTYRIDLEVDFDSQVDAWGDIAVPFDAMSTLRVRNDIAIDITIYMILWGIPIEIYHDEMSYINYTWVCEDEGMAALIMSLEGETNPNFDLASAFSRVYEVTVGDYAVTLEPENPPVIVPPSGGVFTFDGTIQNNMGETGEFDFWVGVFLPSGQYYGPVLSRSDLSLPAGLSITRQLSQNVPAAAPAGLFYYVGFLGDSENTIIKARGGFTFTKEE